MTEDKTRKPTLSGYDFSRPLELWGEESQKNIAIEEAAELITVLQWERRGLDAEPLVKQEIADVLIVAHQLRYMYGAEEIDRIVGERLERLESCIEAGEDTIPNDANPYAGATEPPAHPRAATKATGQEARPAFEEIGYTQSFADALIAAKKGKRTQRAGWNGKNEFVKLRRPDNDSMMNLPCLCIECPRDNEHTPDERRPWQATQADILAEDWGVFE